MKPMPCSNTAAEREYYRTRRDAPEMSESFIRAEMYDKSAEEKVWDRFAFIFDASNGDQDKLHELTQSALAEDNDEKRRQLYARIGMHIFDMKYKYYLPLVTA